MLAEAHNWTPDQVDAMDPAFIAELLAYKQARAQDAALTPEQRETRQKVATAKRTREHMKQRNGDGRNR